MTVFPSLAFFIGLLINVLELSRAQTVKEWLTNTNFDNPRNWDVGHVPCLTNNVVFPSDLNLPVALPRSLVEVKSVVLPRVGVISLPYSTPGNDTLRGLTLTSKSIHASCSGGDVTFTRKGVAYWADPKQWSGWNEATPHLERIPCSTDIARFPAQSSFYVATPMKSPAVAFVELYGQRFSGQLLTSILSSPMGTEEFPMGAFITATGSTCQEPTGCECDNEFLTEEICSHVVPSLSQCDNPVKPIGFCHSICGAYFLFLNGSVDRVKKFINEFRGSEDVISHVSRTSGFLQIVLIDREGTSSGSLEETAGELYNALLDSSLVTALKNMNSLRVSGMKYDRINLSDALSHFMMMALGAVFCFVLLICVYQNDRSFLRYFSLSHRVYDGTVSFARFENYADVVDLIQEPASSSDEALNRRENQSDGPGLAFHNILYSEGPQYQEVTLNELATPPSSSVGDSGDESKDSNHVTLKNDGQTTLSTESN